MSEIALNQPRKRLLTGAPFALIPFCFLLSFMTLTATSCDGKTLATMQASGTDLLRHDHQPVHVTSDGGPGDAQELVSEAGDMQPFAVAAFVAALLGLLATLLPIAPWARFSLVLGIGCLWLLLVLCVVASDVGSGLALAVLLSVVAVSAAAVAVIAARRRPAEGTRVAGFARRCAGWLVDVALILCVIAVAGEVLPQLGAPPVPVALILIALPVLYRAAMEGSPMQATVGERVLGVRVANLDGLRLSPPRALLRAVCEFGFFFTLFGLGHLATAFTPDRRALHDVFAGTIVVPEKEALDAIG